MVTEELDDGCNQAFPISHDSTICNRKDFDKIQWQQMNQIKVARNESNQRSKSGVSKEQGWHEAHVEQDPMDNNKHTHDNHTTRQRPLFVISDTPTFYILLNPTFSLQLTSLLASISDMTTCDNFIGHFCPMVTSTEHSGMV